MVKVVGRDENAVKRVTCRGCASILEYTRSEVKSYTSTDYSGSSDITDYVPCPTCGGKAVVRSS